MRKNLDAFIAHPDITVRRALKLIDDNKKGFLVIADSGLSILGTLTDGDVRRAFLRDISLDDAITGIYTRNPICLKESDGIAKATELFKSELIKFLPVIDNHRTIQNIITKNQMHTLLLQDIHADLMYDFMSLDEGVVDYEIFQRPWGFYKTTVMNDYFQSKVISVNPNSQLSLQSHDHREEHWIIAHGRGSVQLDKSIIEIRCGSSVYIPKGTMHRLTNTDDKESLIIIEVQIGDYFGEDDIIRYEDIYGRV